MKKDDNSYLIISRPITFPSTCLNLANNLVVVVVFFVSFFKYKTIKKEEEEEEGVGVGCVCVWISFLTKLISGVGVGGDDLSTHLSLRSWNNG